MLSRKEAWESRWGETEMQSSLALVSLHTLLDVNSFPHCKPKATGGARVTWANWRLLCSVHRCGEASHFCESRRMSTLLQ